MASQRSDPFFSLPILLFTHHVGQTTVQHVSSESCKCLENWRRIAGSLSIPHRDYFCFALFVFQHLCSWDHKIWFPTSFSCSLIIKCLTAGYILISMLIFQNFFCLDKTINRDCLWYHNGSQFVTWDNDPASNICCGGWWYKVNCTSAQDSNLRIHWSRLDSSDAGKSAPTTTETKIRPVNFSKNCFTY